MNKVGKYTLGVIVGLLIILAGLISCSSDEGGDIYPSLLSEFADVCTNTSGEFSYLLTDEGVCFPIVNPEEIRVDSLTPDSSYRVLSRYEHVDGGVKIYSLQAIYASYAQPASDFANEMKNDAVEMQSLWRGGNYLNMVLLVKAQSGKHEFRFVEDSLTTSPTGRHFLYLRLYHDASNDVQAYTKRAYLSLPLLPYTSRLAMGDSIIFRIPTSYGWQDWVRRY